MENPQLRKVLVLNHNKPNAEYYGYVDTIGWCTAQSPIEHFTEDATWEDIKEVYPNEHFNGVSLVTIQITIID